MNNVKRVVSLLVVFVFMMVSILPASVFAIPTMEKGRIAAKPYLMPSEFNKNGNNVVESSTGHRTIHILVAKGTKVGIQLDNSNGRDELGSTLIFESDNWFPIDLYKGTNTLTLTTRKHKSGTLNGKYYSDSQVIAENTYKYEVVVKEKKPEPKKTEPKVNYYIKLNPNPTKELLIVEDSKNTREIKFDFPKYDDMVGLHYYASKIEGDGKSDISGDIKYSERNSEGMKLPVGVYKVSLDLMAEHWAGDHRIGSKSVYSPDARNYRVVYLPRPEINFYEGISAVEIKDGNGLAKVDFSIVNNKTKKEFKGGKGYAGTSGQITLPEGQYTVKASASIKYGSDTYKNPVTVTKVVTVKGKDDSTTKTPTKTTTTTKTPTKTTTTTKTPTKTTTTTKTPTKTTTTTKTPTKTTTTTKTPTKTTTTTKTPTKTTTTTKTPTKTSTTTKTPTSDKDKIIVTTPAPVKKPAAKDKTAPVGTVKIDEKKGIYDGNKVDLTLTVNDDVSKADKIQIKLSNDNKFDNNKWQSFQSKIPKFALDNNGTNTVYVLFKDKSGKTSTAKYKMTSNQKPNTNTAEPKKTSNFVVKSVNQATSDATIGVVYASQYRYLLVSENKDMSNSKTFDLKANGKSASQVLYKLSANNAGKGTVYGKFLTADKKGYAGIYTSDIAGATIVLANPTSLTEAATINLSYSNGPIKVTFPKIAGTTTTDILYSLNGRDPYIQWKPGETIDITYSRTLKASSIYDSADPNDHRGPRSSQVVTYNFTLPVSKVVEVKDPTSLTQDTTVAQTYTEPIKIKFPSIAGTQAEEIWYSLNGNDPYIVYKGEAVEITESKTLKIRTIYDSADPNDHLGPRPSFVETYNFTINK